MYHKNLRQFRVFHNDGKVENYRLKLAFNKPRAGVQRHRSGQTQTVGRQSSVLFHCNFYKVGQVDKNNKHRLVKFIQ